MTKNDFTIKDTFQFVEEISKHENSNYFMASFDIKSLFTNIPLDETLNLTSEKLFNSNATYYGFDKINFVKLLEHAIKDILFVIDKMLYKQINGVAMGNPLGPTLANVFLCHHETNWLENCPIEFKPVLYRRYIDDTFLLFRHSSHAAKFLNYLNSQHSSIQFTCDTEKHNKINFLDVLIENNGSNFETEVYRKETFTGLGMKFNSFIPDNYKENLIKCLLDRAYKISSTFAKLHNEIIFLKSYFMNNGFPGKMFEKFVSSFLNVKLDKEKSKEILTVEKKIIFVKIPYFGPASFLMKRQLKALIGRFFPHLELKVIFTCDNLIKNYFKIKDKLPLSLVSSVVYQYSCGQCSSSYIGETVKQMKVRISQHKGRSFRTDKLSTTKINSSIFDHFISSNHNILDENFKILKHSNSFDLKILESIFIHKLKPNLNDHSTSTDLFILN